MQSPVTAFSYLSLNFIRARRCLRCWLKLCDVRLMTQVAEAGVLFACQRVTSGKQCKPSSLACINREASSHGEAFIEGRLQLPD